jgi:acetyl esterase/lipase
MMLAVLLLTCCPSSLAQTMVTPSSLLDDTWKPGDLVYREVDGRSLRLHTFYPEDHSASDRRPVVVGIHGGGWTSGSPELFYPHARYFARRGAVGVAVEYRLKRDSDPSVAHSVEDCQAALSYLREHADSLGIDPRRIAVIGDSAGGHLAACLGTLAGPRADAVVACSAIYDVTGRWARAAATDEERRRLSPLFQVGADASPMLLMHGTADRVVEPDQAQAMADALTSVGVDHELILVDGAGHAFVLVGYRSTDEELVAIFRTIDAWLVEQGLLEEDARIGLESSP